MKKRSKLPIAILSLLLIISMMILGSCGGGGEDLISGSQSGNAASGSANTDQDQSVTTSAEGTEQENTPSTSAKTESGSESSPVTSADPVNGDTTVPATEATPPVTSDPDVSEKQSGTDNPVTDDQTGITTGEPDKGETPDSTEDEDHGTSEPAAGSGEKKTVSSSYGAENYTLTITAVSGSFDISLSDRKLTVSFTEDSELSLSGTFAGSIVFSGAEDADLQIDLEGCTIIGYSDFPALYIESASDCDISVKSGTENFIYDKGEIREELSSALYCTCDLKLKGSGKLTVESDNNNGIHCKDDLTAQKLTLNVNCVDNALKGNDSVSILSGAYTLIARAGDGIKTSSTDISSKNVQRGNITISGGNITIYAACDGIDAAYDVIINSESSAPVVNIFTDKYSEYSEEVTAVAESVYYIRSSSKNYKYSICYTANDGSVKWVNSTGYKSVSTGRNSYYYYEMEKDGSYQSMTVYVYTSSQTQGQADDYYIRSSQMTLNNSYDTVAFSIGRNGQVSFSWTNYGTQQQGGPGGWGGGMGGGNRDKGDYSTKGIKSGNAVTIQAGIINIKSYDDAVHANSDSTLESGATPTGNVTISGGTLTVYTSDDGIHADGTLTISGGTVTISGSYEGMEANTIKISGGRTYVSASDDGVNASSGKTTPSISVTGGYLDVNVSSSGDTDGIDSNGSYAQSGGIVITRGPNQSMSAALDTDGGATISGGTLIILGYGNVKTGASVRSYSLSLNSSGSHTVTIDGESCTFTNNYSYGRTIVYSSVPVTG